MSFFTVTVGNQGNVIKFCMCHIPSVESFGKVKGIPFFNAVCKFLTEIFLFQ